MKDTDVFNVIADQPGATGFQIWRTLHANSRAAKWFGADSLLALLFGPTSGWMYVSLARLEEQGKIASVWGVATPERGGHRPRHYFAVSHEPGYLQYTAFRP